MPINFATTFIMKLDLVNQEFDVWEIKSFLDIDECNYLINFSEKVNFPISRVDSQEALNKINPEKNNFVDRELKRLVIDNNDIAVIIWERLPKEISLLKSGNFTPSSVNNEIRIYKYLEDDEFKEHFDSRCTISNTEMSFYSILIYLNDEFKGGETSFKTFQVLPEIGKLVMFPHQLLHAGQKVINGTKYILRTDLILKE